MEFSIKGFLSKCDRIRSFLRIWSHLLKKPIMENFIFYAVTNILNVLCTFSLQSVSRRSVFFQIISSLKILFFVHCVSMVLAYYLNKVGYRTSMISQVANKSTTHTSIVSKDGSQNQVI